MMQKAHGFLAHSSWICGRGKVVVVLCEIKQLRWRVVRASASGAVDFGLIPSRVKPVTLKLVVTAFLFDVQRKGTVWRTSRQLYLLCRWEKHLTGFLHLGVVNRSLATPKRARIAH